MNVDEEDPMTGRRERNAWSLAAAGIGIMGAAVVFGLTTNDDGAIDWVSVITAISGLVMTLTGLVRVYRGQTPHTG